MSPALVLLLLTLVLAAAPLEAQHQTGTSRWADTTTQAGTTVIVYGSTTVAVDSVDTLGITIAPGESWQAKVDSYPAGTAFVAMAGVHRLQFVVPKSQDRFTGLPGAVLSGARLLTTWTPSGGRWYASGQTQQGTVFTAGACEDSGLHPLCHVPEEVLRDSTLLIPVGSLAALTAGHFYFDYGADRIDVADDPTGHIMQASVTNRAIYGPNATGVSISNLTVELYSTAGQGTGAIEGGAGWVIDSVVSRWNHGTGLRAGSHWSVRRSHFTGNGQLCMNASVPGGTADSVLVEDTELGPGCNSAGFNPGFAAGGFKFTNTRWLTARRNHIWGNAGNGLWGDLDNEQATLGPDNVVEYNANQGIFLEISWAGKILGNTVRGNGTDPSDAFVGGTGILVSATPDVEVSGNVVTGNAHGIVLLQQNRGSGTYGEHLVRNANVHDNQVTMSRGDQGFKGAYQTADFSFNRNNRFEANRYRLAGSAGFVRAGKPQSWTQWRAGGMDTSGSLQ